MISRFRFSLLLSAVLGLALTGPLRADDVANMFGITGLIGPVFPVAPEAVTSNTPSTGLDIGAQFSMMMSHYLGIGISYENMSFGHGQRVAPLNVLFMTRFMPESRWTPTFAFGPGGARGIGESATNNFSFKAALGVDYFINPTLALGPQLDYYYISDSGGKSLAYAHLIGVNLGLTYFFGSPSGRN